MASKKQKSPPVHKIRDELAESGDLRGFLEHILITDAGMVHPNTGTQLCRCLKNRSKDTDALCDDGFALSIELAVGLLARISHLIHSALQHEDDGGRPLRGIPDTLAPWLERAERISRFVAEISAARARIQHLRRLAQEDDRQPAKTRSKRVNPQAFRSNGHVYRNGHDNGHGNEHSNGHARRNGAFRLAEVLGN